MRYNIKGRNLEIGERTKEKISAKIDRIKKLFPEDTQVNVSLSAGKLDMTVEVTISMAKRLLRAEATDAEMMAAVDKVVDILEHQVIKYKNRLRSKMRQNISFKEEYESLPLNESEILEEDESYKIVKNKKFVMRPMDPEEAVMQMELIGHTFFVFRDAQSELVSVVYKRKDGTYGLIQPD
ncbi:MAG: ribosome-associated translation inhibitor RaiA [Clostridiales bacterium]|nr:ribosome-associated translation inhibitor RaiA [Clostridiales bacterium]